MKFTEVSIGFEHAMAIDQDGKLWGWGINDHNQLGMPDREIKLSKPFSLYSLNNLGLKALKVSCGAHHSLVIFEKDGNEVLYTVGTNSYMDYYGHLG